VALPRYVLRHPGRSLAIATLLTLIGAGVATAGAYLSAAYHLRAARSAMERYHSNEADEHLRQCLSVWSRDPETLLLASRVARRLGKIEEAEERLAQYQEVVGKDDKLQLESVLVKAERGDVDSVSKFCQTLVEQNDPATPLILEALAKGYLRMYRPHDAEMRLKLWLELEPDNPQAHLLRGNVFDHRSHITDAIAAYRRALELDPDLHEARLRLAGVLVQNGMAAEAIPHLEYLRPRYPNNPWLLLQLARSRDKMGQGEEAAKIMDELLARHPNYGPALVERGRLTLRDGSSAEAEKILRRAITLEPGDAVAYNQLALALVKNGKPDEAEKVQAKMRSIEDDMKLIQDITTVKMQLRPHDPELHYKAGIIAIRAGAIDEGLRWLRSALKEDPNHAASHKALMEHYLRVGDFSRAEEHRKKSGITDEKPAEKKGDQSKASPTSPR
jgi:tetratricopeptide (TPR) repeat protein